MALPKTEGFSRSIVIVTDGYVSVEAEVFDLIRNSLGKANLFAFGIGSSVNRHLIEGMARMGMGEPFVITRAEEASGKATSFRKLIQSPVLTGIHVDFGEFRAYDVEPPGIPDVLAERPVIVFGKWRGKPEGRFVVKGSTGDRPFAKSLEVKSAAPMEANSALRYLWARHRISLLSDYNRLHPKDERIREVTDLGLTYHLMTAYTSFVAVDTQVRLVDGKPVTVKQPLPLPQGVTDLAVGGGVYARKQALAAAPASMTRESIREKEYKGARPARDFAPAEESAKKMTLELREVRVSGGLPKHAVKGIIQREMSTLNDHCMRTLSQGVLPEGRMVFEMIIGPTGRVKSVRGDQGKRVNQSLERCIKEGLKGIQFPGNGGNVVVRVTFGVI
jgi:Ca-activated chloride channel family protein